MARWRQQALIEAPIGAIWELLADPARFPQWAGDSIRTTGYPTKIEKGSRFEQTSPGPLRRPVTTTFEVEELDDLHEIKLRCTSSGYYSRWRLTAARGQTFADVEIGVDPSGVAGRVASVTMTKRHLRRVVDESLDGLRRAAAA
jgi:uncharacterized protein YndB with AHSA1/START domain